MLQTVIATKLGMSQAWTNTGKRLAVTRCRVDNNVVLNVQPAPVVKPTESVVELGFGNRKHKNVSKPLQGKLAKGGFSLGIRGIKGVRVTAPEGENATSLVGKTVKLEEVLSIGDVVQVQGTTKGRGFAGTVKRFGFHGGPKTHGQSDRTRAPGSIGAGTFPGHVWKGKKMPGHYGVDTKSVSGLVVLHLDPTTQELWLSGPIPGTMSGFVTITKTGKTKNITLDKKASGITEVVVEAVEVAEEAPVAATTEETKE